MSDVAPSKTPLSTRTVGIGMAVALAVGLVLIAAIGLVMRESAPELPDDVTWEYDDQGDIAATTTSSDSDTLLQAAEAIRAEVDVEDSGWIVFRCPGERAYLASYKWAETPKGEAQIGVYDADYEFEMGNVDPAC